MSQQLVRKCFNRFLENVGLEIPSKDQTKGERVVPPKIKGKHFTLMDNLVDGDLQWLTPNKESALSILYKEECDLSYYEQCFVTLGKLGEGSYGSVFKVVCKDDRQYYAMKISKEPFKNDSDRLFKRREVLRHWVLSRVPNAVTLCSAWEEDRYTFMLMELCKNTLVKNEPLPEEKCWEVIADIASALDYIHALGWIHFDVKTENIVQGFDGVYKLTDFGYLTDLEMDDQSVFREGDAKYLAPEVLFPELGNLSSKVDIFSLGITILEIAGNLDLPSHGNVWQALREGRLPHKQTEHLSDQLFFLIRDMMDPNPELRPNTRDILHNPGVKAVLKERRRVTGDGRMIDSHINGNETLDEGFSELVSSDLMDMDALHDPLQEPLPGISGCSVTPKNQNCHKRVAERTPPSSAASSTLSCSTSGANNLPYRATHEKILEQMKVDKIWIMNNELLQERSSTMCGENWNFPNLLTPPPSVNPRLGERDAPPPVTRPEEHLTLDWVSLTSPPNSPMRNNSINTNRVHCSTPSIQPYGISPLRLSNTLKKDYLKRKRRSRMIPRNLSDEFDEDSS